MLCDSIYNAIITITSAVIMTTIIKNWFPVPIYSTDETISPEENDSLEKRVMEIYSSTELGADGWFCNTYNTLGSYELMEDLRFNSILNVVDKHVTEFARTWGTDSNPYCTQSWANVSGENSYQEFHTHPGAVFSAVYYVKVPTGSGRIIFQNPTMPDMCPPPNPKGTEYANDHCIYTPLEGTLLIFRSYLRHMVEIGKNKDPRITLAFNYAF